MHPVMFFQITIDVYLILLICRMMTKFSYCVFVELVLCTFYMLQFIIVEFKVSIQGKSVSTYFRVGRLLGRQPEILGFCWNYSLWREKNHRGSVRFMQHPQFDGHLNTFSKKIYLFQALVPVLSVPLLDYTLEFLSLGGIEETFLFCTTHVEAIKDHVRLYHYKT